MSRGERRARTEAVVARRKLWWDNHYQSSRYAIDELSEKQIGRCRRHHPCDCGTPKCRTCHSEKLSGHPPVRDLRQEEGRALYPTRDQEHPLYMELEYLMDGIYHHEWELYQKYGPLHDQKGKRR